MKVEVRNDRVIIDGYVNAVERESKVLYDTRGEFIEKIRAGVFQKALERADNVKVLLDHEQGRDDLPVLNPAAFSSVLLA